LPATDTGPGGQVVLLRDITAQDEMDRFQRELVAAVSHEIRAPLTNIDITVDLLAAATADDRIRAGLETIRAQSQRLAELATRTLDVSRLDSGDWQPEPRPLPVNLLIADLARQWQDVQPERAITVVLPDERLWVWADEQAVVGVLNELLSNAVRYAGARTAITLSAARGPEGSVTLAVTDQGPGIPAEKQARIFDRFYRADTRDNQEAYGVGLGLYTTRRRVELMGGRIGVTSEPDRGSRFAFTLPALDAVRTAGPIRGDA
jgi:signal transduction histidine kinase